jgi:hypothetical protein
MKAHGHRTRVDKVSAELVTLTYGTIVAQLCKDYEYNYADVNKQLDRMGYNIGIRLIEDFLAKSGIPACTNFREVAEMISKVAPHASSSIRKLMCRVRSALRSSSISHLQSRTGPATISSSPSSSKRIHLQTLSSFLMTAVHRTNFGSQTYLLGS